MNNIDELMYIIIGLGGSATFEDICDKYQSIYRDSLSKVQKTTMLNTLINNNKKVKLNNRDEWTIVTEDIMKDSQPVKPSNIKKIEKLVDNIYVDDNLKEISIKRKDTLEKIVNVEIRKGKIIVVTRSPYVNNFMPFSATFLRKNYVKGRDYYRYYYQLSSIEELIELLKEVNYMPYEKLRAGE